MAETTSKRKQFKVKNDGGYTDTDRISTLPDSILLHILSFLPTKTCVTTMSLVSRRWRNLWKDLQVFDFYDMYATTTEEQRELFKKFAVFVNAVLTHRKSGDIRKMRLFCPYSQTDAFSAGSVNTWVRTAIGPHLEELRLAIFSVGHHDFHLPLTIFTICPNLVSLSLSGDILLQLLHSTVIRLPSLKKLLIDSRHDVDVTSVDMLVSACPILETLELSFSTESSTTLHVPPSLKRLKLTIENDQWTYLQIDAPALKYLRLTNITFRDGHGSVGNLHNVEEAYLDLFNTGESKSINRLLNFLRALSRVKHLVLGCSTTKWLFGFSITGLPGLDFPKFGHLIHLELIPPAFNMTILFDVLQKCPMLQEFVIQIVEDPLPIHAYGWMAQPKVIPNCLLYHLTFIHFKGYTALSDQMEVARYVLRNGLVLKTMLISGLSLDQMEKWDKYLILQQFSDTPMGSSICQLKFD